MQIPTYSPPLFPSFLLPTVCQQRLLQHRSAERSNMEENSSLQNRSPSWLPPKVTNGPPHTSCGWEGRRFLLGGESHGEGHRGQKGIALRAKAFDIILHERHLIRFKVVKPVSELLLVSESNFAQALHPAQKLSSSSLC